MPLLAVLLALLAARGFPDELDQHLAELSAPSAALRSEAQAWIEIHARREDFPRLAEAARREDAEVRGRLARALAADDRHLALAVLFAEERTPELAALGRSALADAVLRWNEALSEPPLVGDDLERRLARFARNSAQAPFSIDLAQPLAANLDLLRRLGGLSVGVVADPDLMLRPAEERALERPASGGWDVLLLALAREKGVGLEGFGLGALDAPYPPAKRWLRFAPLRTAGRESAVEILTRWCLRVAEAGTPEGRRAAARALAAAGWPAALAWLEERWRELGDEAALDGLLLAASSGRVVPSLAREDALRELCASADRALASDALARTSELLHAAASVGCLDSGGRELVPVLLEGWPASSARGRWWRLAVLEAWGCAVASDAPAEGVLRGLLADASTPAELALQALRAWCATTVGAARALELVDSGKLIAHARRTDQARELLALLERSGVMPPAGQAAERAATGPDAALLAAWSLALDRPEAAAQALAQAFRAGASERARELLSDQVARGAGERVLAALTLARGSAGAEGDPAIEETAFRLGLLTDQRLTAFVEQHGPPAELPERLLGAWAVYAPDPGAEEARELLLLRLQQALGTGQGRADCLELERAIEEALAGLFARGLDIEAQRLVGRARRFLETYSQARLARELLQAGFPAPPRAAPEPLVWRERAFDPATLGR